MPLFVALTVIGPLGTSNMNATPSSLVDVARPLGKPPESISRYAPAAGVDDTVAPASRA